MICPKCKSEIKDDSKFCGKCGQKISRCPTCGRPILERARFCVYDGTMIPDDMLNLLPEETAEDITENQEQQERREQAVVKKTGHQKKKKVFVVLGVILGIVACAGVGYAAVHALSGKKNVDQKQEQKIAREEKKETTAVPEKISESSKLKQKTDQDEIASVSENTTENQETDTKVKTKSETEYAETEENKKTVSESKEETSTVSESKAPEIIHTYEVIAGDLSWEDAKNACEERGGYLATITSEEEYEKISEMADRSGLTYLWLGAKLQSDTEEWKQAGWITGEDWTFDNWYPGEPSRQDTDGTKELFLCMWKAKYNEEEIGWTFNDQRNDIVGAFPKIAGKVGYVCEYERETNG
ncbi:double zinc ribbon domain-containing protein [Blautia sp. AF17-9LB]|uniref:double zinc ribbon domain-containing protein n=1 Tax=Blautia sp. AF17-9LB TaxID=2292959 RepID=UPI001314C2E6|nr:zinc ribbon domain-containing protein [Blautia sp. AF17-9LB]